MIKEREWKPTYIHREILKVWRYQQDKWLSKGDIQYHMNRYGYPVEKYNLYNALYHLNSDTSYFVIPMKFGMPYIEERPHPVKEEERHQGFLATHYRPCRNGILWLHHRRWLFPLYDLRDKWRRWLMLHREFLRVIGVLKYGQDTRT